MSARDFCGPMSPFSDWSDSHTDERAPADVQWSVDKHRKRIVDFLLQSAVAVEESSQFESAAKTEETTEELFYRLAEEWSKAIGNSSSLTAVARHPKYREIIDLGWKVLPFMLIDLQRNRRFWFPALHEITGIRPFDNRDAGNSERMIRAWVQWGKRKKLI